MSINFHANQYEKSFSSDRLQNWELPKNTVGKFPRAKTGFTRILTNDRGHLLTNVPKERGSPWGTFVGTWDMPLKIPGNRITVPTARTEEAILKGQLLKEKGNIILSGGNKQSRTVDPLPIKMDAPEDQRPAGITCVPAGGSGATPTCVQPCPQLERTHYDDNQPRAMSRKESRESLKWPKANTPHCQSPVVYADNPHCVTQMCVADVNV
ncbi:protein Flattop [Biomphalaria pfeifferi]|uniref:Cilia- and flagella-associated protein 126 n=1 Tax=Biomphalaria pfeifferi TaxID=112525 RepID=A0AAD8EU92_BIOPF|nr:protein Flattop [Biomphalaria pfeifferi]